MKTLFSTTLALAALSAASSAQSEVRPISIQGAPHHATINMATGEITRGSQQKACPLILKYENTDTSGYYSTLSPGMEWLDWGTMPDSGTSSDLVGRYCTGYATTIMSTWLGGPGTSMCNWFYDDVVGWCAESGTGLMPTTGFCFSALPGSPDGIAAWGWIICFSLTGGWEFTQDSGPFGYSMSFFDYETGPLLCYAGGANMGQGYDSNGQEDAFDIYIPYVSTGVCGTYWFGGYPSNYSSWYLEVYTEGTPASSTWYCGTGANDVYTDFTVTGEAIIGGSFCASVTCTFPQVWAMMTAYSTPAALQTSYGEILVNMNDPNGELSGNPSAFGHWAQICVDIPMVPEFCGFVFFVQGVSRADELRLTCAAECMVGWC